MIGTALTPALDPARPTVALPAWDESWFAGFHERTSASLSRYVLHLCADRSVADDVVQEAYLRLLAGRFRSTMEDEVRAYLFRIALNLVRDRHRRRRPEVDLEQAPAQAVAVPRESTAARIDIERVLRRLRDRERTLLWLAHVECWSHREIALMMNVREASVRPLLHRARRRFQDEAATLHGSSPSGWMS